MCLCAGIKARRRRRVFTGTPFRVYTDSARRFSFINIAASSRARARERKSSIFLTFMWREILYTFSRPAVGGERGRRREIAREKLLYFSAREGDSVRNNKNYAVFSNLYICIKLYIFPPFFKTWV